MIGAALKQSGYMRLKTRYIILLLLTGFTGLSAQTFTFEDAAVPSGWTVVSNGNLSLSAGHYKEGSQSLCWEANGTSVLTVSFSSFTASTGNSAFFQVYSPEITNDTLVVDFLYNASSKRTARFLLNYKGWREFNRAYKEYISNVSTSITSVRMTLQPASSGSRKIYFDDVNLNKSTASSRIAGSQWVLDKAYFSSGNTQLELFANPVDVPLETPAAEELADLAALRTLLSRTPSAGTATNLTAARIFVNSLGITRDEDGSVKGKVIDTSASALTTSVVNDYVSKLEVLAAAGLSDETYLDSFRNFLDHLLDQGLGEGANFIISTTDYTNARTIPEKLLNILPACTDAEKDEVIKLVRWISYYGLMYEPEDSYLSALNSDIIYLYLPHLTAAALFHTDNAVAVREMKVLKRFLERNTEYSPGGSDILKPDGTGFHHNSHYNNYMYAYQTWTDCLYSLKETVFRISPEAYQRFKKAIISNYIMATLDTGNTRHYANTFAGRNPFASGIQVFYSKALFEELVEIGGDCLGKDMDEELAAAYNYFFESNKYDVPAHDYEGFFQFNYSGSGIFRKHNWVATMRAPTTEFWSSEIYNNENRFGRYQGHGTLEITYAGTVATSGYPGNSTGGGWDWNVVPGATTVHYTSWQEMMPYKSVTGRFDQYTRTKNFAGALAWDSCGIFAADFDQIDTWSSSAFTATNLTFRKSVFAFGNILISLGSGISSSGSYDDGMITATNLFQNLTSSASGALLLNGTEINRPYNATTISSAQDNWMVAPQGTGYFIPKGNDDVVLFYNAQKTPVETGVDYASPATVAYAAKAYINHGVKPSGKSYAFVVVPATNAADMQEMAASMANGGGSVYEIHSQTGNLHALTYKPDQTTAYAFFGPSFSLDFGVVKSATAAHLLMHRPDDVTGRQYFAASCPDLKPQSDPVYGWKASSAQTTLTIRGEWLPVNAVDGVQFGEPANGETQVTITFTDGEPVYFALKRTDDTTVTALPDHDWLSFSQYGNEIGLIPGDVIPGKTNIRIYSAPGGLVYNKTLPQLDEVVYLPVTGLKSGMYICRVETGRGTKVFKWIQTQQD